MKIHVRDVASFIKRPPAPIRAVLLYGPDQGMVKEQAKNLCLTIHKYLDDPFSVVNLDHDVLLSEPARLIDEAHALSFGGGRRLIRIREASDKITPAVKELLAHVQGDSLTVIEGGDLGPASALRKLFEKAENAAALPFYIEEGNQLGQRLQSMLMVTMANTSAAQAITSWTASITATPQKSSVARAL